MNDDEETYGPAIFAAATVAPGKTEDLVLGVYENCIPEPRLRLELSARAHGRIEASLIRHEEYGDYTLICHMSNKGRSPLRVVVRNMGAAHAYHPPA